MRSFGVSHGSEVAESRHRFVAWRRPCDDGEQNTPVQCKVKSRALQADATVASDACGVVAHPNSVSPIR